MYMWKKWRKKYYTQKKTPETEIDSRGLELIGIFVFKINSIEDIYPLSLISMRCVS
jgi:hypothetical protein